MVDNIRIFMLQRMKNIIGKTDVVDLVATKCKLSKAAADLAVSTVFESIIDSLKNGGSVRITGFGSFSVSERKATTGRNPRTGEKIDIPAANKPKFKPGKTFEDAVAL